MSERLDLMEHTGQLTAAVDDSSYGVKKSGAKVGTIHPYTPPVTPPVPEKGMPRCVAISPGVKGRGLRCPCSPREIEMAFGVMFRFLAPTPLFFGRSKRGCEKRRESRRCVNDCDPGAAATGKMPVVPVRPYVGRRWNAAPTGRAGARPSREGGGEWRLRRSATLPARGGCKKTWGRAFFNV